MNSEKTFLHFDIIWQFLSCQWLRGAIITPFGLFESLWNQSFQALNRAFASTQVASRTGESTARTSGSPVRWKASGEFCDIPRFCRGKQLEQRFPQILQKDMAKKDKRQVSANRRKMRGLTWINSIGVSPAIMLFFAKISIRRDRDWKRRRNVWTWVCSDGVHRKGSIRSSCSI